MAKKIIAELVLTEAAQKGHPIAWARKVIATAESASGAVQIEGRMVDKPVLLRAHTLLAKQRP